MRLAKKFVKTLEALSQDQSLSATERLEAAGLLVRLYTASPLPRPARKPKIDAPEAAPTFESDSLKRIAENL